jgi:penicillin-binding protein 1A
VNARTGETTAPGAPGSILEAFKPGTEPGAMNSASGAFADSHDLLLGASALPASADAVNVQIGPGLGGLY